jgi:hypothetical protein
MLSPNTIKPIEVKLFPHIDEGISYWTIVNDRSKYSNFVSSVVDSQDSEVPSLYFIDNVGGDAGSAYGIINKILRKSTTRYTVVCHQDVLLQGKSSNDLVRVLQDLDAVNPLWAVCGVAGMTEMFRYAGRVTSPYGASESAATLPCHVIGLDECFLVYNLANPVSLTQRLSGFHHYGIESCYSAHKLGYSAHVIDFELYHASTGNFDRNYERQGELWHRLRNYCDRPRWYQATYHAPKLVGHHPLVSKVFRKLTRSQCAWFNGFVIMMMTAIVNRVRHFRV